jgi:hypothetical protein
MYSSTNKAMPMVILGHTYMLFLTLPSVLLCLACRKIVAVAYDVL